MARAIANAHERPAHMAWWRGESGGVSAIFLAEFVI
jgi:hypothetical protein